eukprot:GDKI01033247.1.p1 GENE.GDKI01033247.1~~GDKI01033247.1.p1  ORF type:complete len:125 (+),score=26.30 GDKI01033247.1:394-768(+)
MYPPCPPNDTHTRTHHNAMFHYVCPQFTCTYATLSVSFVCLYTPNTFTSLNAHIKTLTHSLTPSRTHHTQLRAVPLQFDPAPTALLHHPTHIFRSVPPHPQLAHPPHHTHTHKRLQQVRRINGA